MSTSDHASLFKSEVAALGREIAKYGLAKLESHGYLSDVMLVERARQVSMNRTETRTGEILVRVDGLYLVKRVHGGDKYHTRHCA